MSRFKLRCVVLMALCLGILAVSSRYLRADTGSWLVVKIGLVGAASADILSSAVDDVAEKGMVGLLVELDTPGGSLENTRSMVKEIMNAPFPVIVWVGPSGARAGSAGAFITLSAHIAAMAQGTNIGAAHPVQASGKDIDKGDMHKKVENDAIAFIESIADTRGRNKEMATSFVINSLSITAQEALDHEVIDLIANDKREIFNSLKGRKLQISKQRFFVMPENVPKFVPYQTSAKQEFLKVLSNPNLFYLLFIGGLMGIGFELTHPGSLIPGVLGAISLLLSLIAMSVLPVNFGGLILILAAVGFMVAEVFLPSFGILGIGGIVAFVIGSFLLVDPGNEQGLQISIWTIAPVTFGLVAFGLLVGYLIMKVERSKVVSGASGMIGVSGKVSQDFSGGSGQVFINGEYWSAECRAEVELIKGDIVKVDSLEGLVLTVEKFKEEV